METQPAEADTLLTWPSRKQTASHVGFLVPDLAAVRGLVVDEDIPIVSENDRLRQLTVEFPDNGEALRAWYAHTFGATASMRRQFFSAEFPRGPGFPGPRALAPGGT